DKVTLKGHKTAERMDIFLLYFLFLNGISALHRNSFYFSQIVSKCLANKDCSFLYCRVCKICFHRYKCECHEYSVKTNIC
ncbi:hypothetical protein ILUMI_03067, partial [Ignelater luminosus]